MLTWTDPFATIRGLSAILLLQRYIIQGLMLARIKSR